MEDRWNLTAGDLVRAVDGWGSSSTGEPPHPPPPHEIHFRGYKLWNNAESLGHYKYMDEHSPAALAPRLKGEIDNQDGHREKYCYQPRVFREIC